MSSVFVKTSENLRFSVKKVTLSSYFPPNYSDQLVQFAFTGTGT